ncbi:MAG TPA: hypothetical protein VGR62_00925 [Candidatus Binatia bacterium]|jgi:hypothetical protein|nr:hypothetical protein [Candidatus Binatia bacterium]
MSNRTIGAVMWIMLCTILAGAGAAWAQPAMDAPGCCCVTEGIAFRCSIKTQADCMAVQPKAPTFKKMADWKAAWDKFIAADKAAEARTLSGGWVAESCQEEINPATGEPRGAPTGCCCFPPKDAAVCKAAMTEFDCKAECSMLKDGRLPSGCTWATGACKH